MKNLYFLLLISFAWIVCSCSDDDDTTPSMADEDRLESLIDKSNPDIMEFKEKYGTYILYEFDHILDFAYQFEEAAAWRNAEVTRLAKEDVPEAVKFLKENFFSCYDDKILKEYFPRKLLLCNKITGGTLGLSEPKREDGATQGTHAAVANLNSMTIAGLDKTSLEALEADTDKKKEYLQQLHFIYLAGYLVNARTLYYPNETFFDYSSTLYNSLMDPNRKPASQLSDEFFYQKGFFRVPASDTYFGTADEDLINFTKNLILMDKEMCETLEQYELMKRKMQLAVKGLEALDVKVYQMNEYIERIMDNSSSPSVLFEGGITTANINLRDYPTYKLPVVIEPGAGLKSIIVKDADGNEWYNETEFANPKDKVNGLTLDLTSLTEAKSLSFTVEVTDKFDRVATSAQPYLLNVSVSPMTVTTNQTMKSLSTVVQYRFAIERGVKKLAKAIVYLKDVKLYEIDFADKASVNNIEESVFVSGLVTGDNIIKLEVYEVGMSSASYTTTTKVTVSGYKTTSKTRTLVNLADKNYNFNVKYLSRPATQEYGQSLNIFAAFAGIQDKDKPIDAANGVYDYKETPKRHTWYVIYDGSKIVKMVNRMRETIIVDGYPSYVDTEQTYEFVYNVNNEVEKVTYNGADYVTDIVFENGLMTSYTIDGTEVKPQYVTAPVGSIWEGSVVRVDCMNAPELVFKFTGNEEGNPFYIPGLPDVIPGEMLGFPTQLCYTPYLFNEIGTQSGIWEKTTQMIGTFNKDSQECQYQFRY